jgi:hypothetical protein
MGNVQPHDRGAHALGDRPCVGLVGHPQEDCKSLAADAATGVRAAVGGAGDRFGDRAQLEDASAGTQLIQELKRVTGLQKRIVGVPAIVSKEARAEAQTAIVQAGRVALPESAPWVETFVSELEAFPLGPFKDQTDAFSMGSEWILKAAADLRERLRLVEQYRDGLAFG